MNSIKTIVAAVALSALSPGYVAATQAAETIKPLQGVSFHTASTDGVAYFLSEKGACRVVVTVSDKAAYAPARFEQAVDPGKPSLHQLDDANALEFACAPEARALSINVLATIAQH